jgi:FAD dependent oxidoreductase TIGR03364
MIIDPRAAIAIIPQYLSEHLDIKFIWGKAVTRVKTGTIHLDKKILIADAICICSGADFETLYPGEFSTLDITKCKLQMMRFVSVHKNFRIGTSLCGGLSLVHYKSFLAAPSLSKLKVRYQSEMSEYLQWGIHVMISQNDKGELTVGDSREYGLTFDPFDNSLINQLVVDYLKRFAVIDDWQLIQTWNGIYPKMNNEETDVFIQLEDGVFIINGLGGAGMTLSFGFAEEVVAQI